MKGCGSCYYRHMLCPVEKRGKIDYLSDEPCKKWREGQCFTCVHRDASDEEYQKRACEAYWPGGCKQYKRDWKEIWGRLFSRFSKFFCHSV